MKKTILFSALAPLTLAGLAFGQGLAPGPPQDGGTRQVDLVEAWMQDFNGQEINRHYLTGRPLVLGEPTVGYLQIDAKLPRWGYWWVLTSTRMAPPHTMLDLRNERSQLFIDLDRVFAVQAGVFDFRGGSLDRRTMYDVVAFRPAPIQIDGPAIPNDPSLLGRMWFAQAVIWQPQPHGLSLSSMCGGAVGNYRRAVH